ncbi:ATP-binding protein [Actinomycetospora sp. NBC_00405]|uniref:ATP-binding protein n=1 Tax=Actinomycetospora sp. NBC_00405 TaxID=2975952 RepID=UPI003FA4AD62
MRVGRGAAPLVGRDDELGVLVGAALSGPGGVTLAAGEAGSGKTRLLDEVAGRAAAAGARVLRGHAVPGGGPFRPLAEALTDDAGLRHRRRHEGARGDHADAGGLAAERRADRPARRRALPAARGPGRRGTTDREGCRHVRDVGRPDDPYPSRAAEPPQSKLCSGPGKTPSRTSRA